VLEDGAQGLFDAAPLPARGCRMLAHVPARVNRAHRYGDSMYDDLAP